MIMKGSISETIFGRVSSIGNAKEYLEVIWKKFKELDKPETHNLGSMRKYIF